MTIRDTKTGKLIYHLTKLSNLDSILKYGLISRRLIIDNDIKHNDIANHEIIDKRTELGLDEYIPFHFHPYSSFDAAVKNTYADEEFIYICVSREVAKFNKFKILPRHPLNNQDSHQLYDYDKGFEVIDWDTMHTLGTKDRYTKSVKMAECLTKLIVPPSVFHTIYVSNKGTKRMVEQKLMDNKVSIDPPYINIGPWL